MYEPERQTTTVRYDVTDDVETVAITAGDAETTVERRDDDTVRIEATNYAVGQTDLSGVTVTQTVTGSHLDVGAGRTGELTLRAADGGVETISVGIPEGVRVTRRVGQSVSQTGGPRSAENRRQPRGRANGRTVTPRS